MAIKSVICQDDGEIRVLHNEVEVLKKCAGRRNILSLISAFRTAAPITTIYFIVGLKAYPAVLKNNRAIEDPSFFNEPPH